MYSSINRPKVKPASMSKKTINNGKSKLQKKKDDDSELDTVCGENKN